jgi:hypothetical protein
MLAREHDDITALSAPQDDLSLLQFRQYAAGVLQELR